MSNAFAAFQKLIPRSYLAVGEVTASGSGVSTVETPDGRQVQARGVFTVGAEVYVKDGQVQGTAPGLTQINVVI